jgi:long-subunit fatty acid transport protein
VSGDFSRNKQTFTIDDDKTEYTRKDWSVEGFAVRSLGDRWALGLRANTGSSTFYNRERSWSVKPGIEYNFFPYEESSRRSLTLQYLVGANHWDYEEETIYGELAETRWQESLTARLSLVQPWGRWSTSVTGQHYLHDLELYSATVSGSLNVRLFQGFSVRVSGNYSWIADQLYLPLSDYTEEEILLRQFQQETTYRYFTSFGIEYRFGSIFNNVVNPRFGGGHGGGMMIIG